MRAWMGACGYLVVTLVALGTASAASRAETPEKESRRTGMTAMGMSMSIGGGVMGFTNDDMADYADVGGLWEARLAVGTRRRVAFEAGYVGGAQSIDKSGLTGNAVLLASGVDADLRVNLLDQDIQPYLLVGVGWKHYNLTNEDKNTSSVRDSDDVFDFPVGAGLGYRIDPVVIDVRAVLRPTMGSDLINTASTNTEAAMHTWTASIKAGWEF